MSTLLKVKITLLEEMLGTAPPDAEVYKAYIASKAPDAATVEDEVESLGVEATADSKMTIFHRDAEGRPYLYDYQIRGFFKESCGMLRMVPKKKSATLKAYKKVIDGLIQVDERRIPVEMAGEIGNCQRTLRAETMQGPRTALASSETVPEGSTMTFTVRCLNPDHAKYVREWLDYGKYHGLGQWRNSGKGKFSWELLEETEEEDD